MNSTAQAKRCIEPEVLALSDYMRKKGMEPDGAEGWLASCSLRWFMGELGIVGKGAVARAIRRAFVNQTLLMLSNYDEVREKFDAMKPADESEVSDDESR